MLDLINVLATGCEDILPIVRFIRQGIMPIIQIGIPIVLIVMGSIDLGKAVLSSDEKEIKGATGKLIKRAMAAIIIFFIPFIVNLLMGLLATANDENIDSKAKANFADCWDQAK